MNKLKEYNSENNTKVDIKNLKSPLMSLEDFREAHKNLIIVCHDVFIKYNNGILLVERNNLPAKNVLWPIGGRVLRGVHTEKSLKQKVKEECNLEINSIEFINVGRTTFETDPFEHNKGTDTLNLVYFAQGNGELKLDNLHKNPIVITKEKYTEEFKNTLHPYVKDFMDIVINKTDE